MPDGRSTARCEVRMRRSSVDGPEGSGGGAEDFPPAAEPREPAEDAAAGPPAEREVKTSRTVVVGEGRESEPPVELTEEHDEESAAPMIDDASPVEDWPEDISAPGLSRQPPPSSTLWTKPIVPTLAPDRPRSEPPPDAAFRADPMSAPVFPVPPPFMPFADPGPFDAAKTARRPAVAPPAPPPVSHWIHETELVHPAPLAMRINVYSPSTARALKTRLVVAPEPKRFVLSTRNTLVSAFV